MSSIDSQSTSRLNDQLLVGTKHKRGVFGSIRQSNLRDKSHEVLFNSFSKNISHEAERKTEIIPVGNKIDTYICNQYSSVVSTNITTVFIEDKYFSYLTNPTNDIKNFFLLREADYFDISKWEPSLTGGKISKEKMEDFVSELNFFFSGNDIMNIIESFNKKRRINWIIFSLCIILLIGSGISLWRVSIDAIDHVYLIVIFSILVLLSLVFFIRSAYFNFFTNFDEELNYSIYMNLLQHKEMVEDLVQRWNDEYFYEQGIIAYSTSIVNYIQFSQEKEKVYILAHNKKPVKE